MADKNLSVRAQLRAAGVSRFRRDVGGIAASAGRASKSVGALTAGVRRFGTVAGSVLGISAAYGFGRLMGEFISKPREAQKSMRALSTVIQQNFGVSSYREAMTVARDLRMELIRVAAVSPGSIEDYQETIRDLGVVAKGTNTSLKDLVSLTRNVVAVTELGGYQKGITGRDIRQILGGQGTPRMIQTVQLKDISLQAARLAREGDKLAAMGLIRRALEVDQEALRAFGQQFDAQFDTMRSNYRLFMEEAGKPVLSHLNKELVKANKWIANNQAKVKQFAKQLAEAGVAVAKGLVRATKWLTENWREVVATVKTLVTLWLASKAVTAIGNMVSVAKELGNVFRGVGGIIGKMAGGIAGVFAATVAGIEAIKAKVANERARAQDRAQSQIREEVQTTVDIMLNSPGNKAGMQQGVNRVARAMEQELKAKGEIIVGGLRFDATKYTMQGLREKAARMVYGEYEKAYGAAQTSKRGLEDIISSAKQADQVDVNIDQRGSHIEVQQRFDRADPDAVFFDMRRDMAAATVRTVVSPYAPART